MNVPGITSPDMSATINGAIKAGWVYVGTTKNHTTGQIQWPETGAVVKFSTTPKSGGWKTVAQLIYDASGVDLRRKGSNRRSRKSMRIQADPQVEASRRKHAQTWEERQAEQAARLAAERIRAAEIEAIKASERRRREIEELMR